ncbi:MAG: leucine-rich repeat domain-containing protein [Sedimentisphaerales bacterium]|nr:leucine-rich repeat domain-containing protein [Sedimentisphaerales bacterium]
MNYTQIKTSRSKCIIAAVIFLCVVIAVFIYRFLTWGSNVHLDEPIPGEEVFIRQAVAKTLNKDWLELTEDDFVKITELEISNKTLSHIKYIMKFPNLQKLYLENIKVPQPDLPTGKAFLVSCRIIKQPDWGVLDLSPLTNLQKLQILKIHNTDIESLKPLLSFKNLKEFSLGSEQLTRQIQIPNLKYIKKLNKLEILRINNIKSFEIKLVKNLKNLQSLYVSYTKISNLDPIKGLTNLREFYIRDCNNISDQQVDELQKALPNLKIYK